LSRGIELVLVVKQETVVLLKVKPIVGEGVLATVKVKYS